MSVHRGRGFSYIFDLAERYGYDTSSEKVFNGKKYVLLNDGLTKKQAQSYAAKLKKMGCSVRITHIKGEGYRVYYRKRV